MRCLPWAGERRSRAGQGAGAGRRGTGGRSLADRDARGSHRGGRRSRHRRRPDRHLRRRRLRRTPPLRHPGRGAVRAPAVRRRRRASARDHRPDGTLPLGGPRLPRPRAFDRPAGPDGAARPHRARVGRARHGRPAPRRGARLAGPRAACHGRRRPDRGGGGVRRALRGEAARSGRGQLRRPSRLAAGHRRGPALDGRGQSLHRQPPARARQSAGAGHRADPAGGGAAPERRRPGRAAHRGRRASPC